MGDKLGLKVVVHVAVVEYLGVEDAALRQIPEDVAVVELGEPVADDVRGALLVVGVVDGRAPLDKLHPYQPVEHVDQCRAAGDVRLAQDVPVAGVTVGERGEDLVGVSDLRDLGEQVGGHLVLKPRVRLENQANEVLPDRGVLVNEAVVVRDAAKHAEETNLVLAGALRIELRGLVVVHRLEVDLEVDAPIEGIVALQQRPHDLYVRPAEDEREVRSVAILVEKNLEDAIHSLHDIAEVGVLVDGEHDLLARRPLEDKAQGCLDVGEGERGHFKGIRDDLGEVFRVVPGGCLAALVVDGASAFGLPHGMEDELALADATPAVDERCALGGGGELGEESVLLSFAADECHFAHLRLLKKVESKFLSKLLILI